MNDMPSSGGRIDIIARCANTALWISHGMRRDVQLHTVLYGSPDPPRYIRFEGERLRKVQPDERNIGIFLKKALERYVPEKETQSTPGIFVSKKGLSDVVNRLKGDIYVLSEEGKDVSEVKFGKDSIFVLGDKEDVPEKDIKALEKLGAKKVSLGEKPYLSSHCVSYLNILLDRQER